MKYYLFLTLGALLTLAACTYTMKIQDGAMAYERKQYAVAVPMLKREYNKAKSRVDKGRLAYRLGQSYEALNKSEDASNGTARPMTTDSDRMPCANMPWP